ncbi:MAG: cytochrome c biogenesis protein CcdA [Rectinemataceae bacterium]|nr:cytochrome c biogenesis protein CcdA [Rectinemataceae bacterium]
MNLPGLPAAFAAGLLSFLSPCVLPLVPGYISFISGFSASDAGAHGKRGRIFWRSLSFVGGFTTAFTFLGVAFSGGAMFAGGAGPQRTFGIAAGILVFFFGLNMVFNVLSFLNREARFHPKGKKVSANIVAVSGPAGAFVMGLAFAAGWSPCIGPILASILLYAGKSGNLFDAAILLLSYSSGLALPFLAAGMFFEKLKPVMDYIKRHGREVRIVSGLLLMAFGLAMAAGSLPGASMFAVNLGMFLQRVNQDNPAIVRLVASVALLIPVFAAGWRLTVKRMQKKGRTALHEGMHQAIVPNDPRPATGNLPDSTGSPGQDNSPPVQRPGVHHFLIGFFLILAILQAAGIVDLAGIISGWLLFQGA